jgi:hypothetical protein
LEKVINFPAPVPTHGERVYILAATDQGFNVSIDCSRAEWKKLQKLAKQEGRRIEDVLHIRIMGALCAHQVETENGWRTEKEGNQ